MTTASRTPQRALPVVPGERAARPAPRVVALKKSLKELPVNQTAATPDRVLDVPDLTADQLAAHEAVASGRAAHPAQQAVLGGVPQQPVVSAANGYTKTRLGLITLVGNVGSSRQIVSKRVAERDLVEFSFAARAFGQDAPTWYRVTAWQQPDAVLDLVRQGTYLQLKGQAVQSQSHRTGKIFLDVTASRIEPGPQKGEQLQVAASRSQKGYFGRLWDALRGR